MHAAALTYEVPEDETRPRGKQWVQQYPEPEQNNSVAVHMERDEQPDTLAGSRQYPLGRRPYPRVFNRGDVGRNHGEKERRFQGLMPDWADSSANGRELRDLVTDVQRANPGGVNPDWYGTGEDPSQVFLRQPAIGDWWDQS